MPVISPAYPEHNTTFTVCASTLKVLQQAIVQGKFEIKFTNLPDVAILLLIFFFTANKTVQKVYNEKCEWSDLLSPAEFVSKYK